MTTTAATVRRQANLTALGLVVMCLCSSALVQAQSRGRTVRFTAADSLVVVVGDSARVGRLYGQAKLNTDDVKLNAHRIDISFDRSELLAKGLQTDTGLVGRPEFEKGTEKFYGDNMTYNLDSGRGRVVGARTKLDEGFIYGGVSKQETDSVLYVKDAMFTTCDHAEAPHYHIRTGRMKIVNGKWIYTGPLHLRILNIPMPIWLPFGFLPATEGRRSGPLPPTYGEDTRGFFLRDFGWYWAINDYMDVQTRLGIWTNGSYQIAPQFRYNKRYAYSGQAAVDWVRSFSGLRDDPDFQQVDTWSLRTNHTQSFGTSASLNAKIDYATSNYLRTVSRGYDDQVRQTIGSDLQFNKRWKGRTLTAYASQRQVLTTGEVQMTLPQLSFSQQTFRPFASGSSSRSSNGILQSLTVAYRGGVTNRYRFVRDTTLAGSTEIDWFEALFSPDKYTQATGDDARFDFKASHSVPIAANFSLNRLPVVNKRMRLNFAPSFQYDEDWYLRTERRVYDADEGRVITTSESEFAPIRQFSTSVNANTEFYGTFPWKIGPFRTFRHVVRPSATMTFRPDFSSDTWGYYRSYIDANGNTVRYAKAGDVRQGAQQALSLRLGNVFQAKRAVPDSLGASAGRAAQPTQLLTLDLSSGFNFAADSLKWNPLTVSARTRVLNRFDFNLSTTLTPYTVDSLGNPIDRYTSKLFRLTNLNFTARTTFSGGRGPGVSRPYSGIGSTFGAGSYASGLDATAQALGTFDSDYRNTPVGYADFSVPWSLTADFTYSVSKSLTRTSRRAIVNTSLDFNLTRMWKVQGRTGYDLVEGEVVTTNITILRDFHDWEMGFNWTPFGQFASYQFDIHLKTGPLKDLLRLRVPQKDDRVNRLLTR